MQTVTLAAIVLFILSCFSPVAATTNEQTLQLVRKDPRSWQKIDTETSAQVCFSRQQGTFICTGQQLEKTQNYALIQRDETAPRGKGYIVAIATTNDDGHISLTGKWKHWRGKVWLVIAEDVRGTAGDERIDKLIHWQPTRYLFETKSLL